MGEGTPLTSERSAAQLLILPERIAGLYQEFAEAHARSLRETMRAQLSLADSENYEQAVDEVALLRTDSENWELCCDLIGRTLDASPEEFDRYHRRYDALRGMSLSVLNLSSLRLISNPEHPDPFIPMVTTAPFEATVVQTDQTSVFRHWGQDRNHFYVDYLRDVFPGALEPFRKYEKDKRVAFFTQARNFLGGTFTLQTSDVPLMRSFADSISSNFGHMNRGFEKEYTLLAKGFVGKACDVVEERAAYFDRSVRTRVVEVAFGLHNINFKDLGPRGKGALLAGAREIVDELLQTNEPDLPEITTKWVREIHHVEAGHSQSLLSTADGPSHSGMGIA